MKIDKNMIDMVLKLNDEQLWNAIKLVATKSGVNVIKDMAQPKDMSKIRNTLSSLNEDDITRVAELLKRGKDNGRQ